jgi:hypothetical protein
MPPASVHPKVKACTDAVVGLVTVPVVVIQLGLAAMMGYRG